MADEVFTLRVDEGCTPVKFEEFRQLKLMCDIELQSLDGRTFSAHRNVLAARCSYFFTMLSSSFQEAKQPVILIDERAEILEEMLRYIYSGAVQITGDSAQDLLRVGNQYNIQALFLAVESYIIENIDGDNCITLIRTARQLNATKLAEEAVRYVEKNLKLVLKFDEIDKNDVIALMAKEDIVAAEIFPRFLEWFTATEDVQTATRILEAFDFKRLDREHVVEMIHKFKNVAPCTRIILHKLAENWEPSSRQKRSELILSGPVSRYFGPITMETKPINTNFNEGSVFYVHRVGDDRVKVIRRFPVFLVASKRTYLVLIAQPPFCSLTFFDFTADKNEFEIRVREGIGSRVNFNSKVLVAIYDTPSKNQGQRNCRLVEVVDSSKNVSYPLNKTNEREQVMVIKCNVPLSKGRFGIATSVLARDYLPSSSFSPCIGNWDLVQWNECELKAASDAPCFTLHLTDSHPQFKFEIWQIMD